MEKFGIFDLLDALSAITEAETDAPEPEPAPARPATDDAAFAPPPYAAPTGPAAAGTNTALSSLLERHERLSKKIDGKK